MDQLLGTNDELVLAIGDLGIARHVVDEPAAASAAVRGQTVLRNTDALIHNIRCG